MFYLECVFFNNEISHTFCLLVGLLQTSYLIDVAVTAETFIQSHKKVNNVEIGKEIQDLCFHPYESDRLFATTENGIILFDWSEDPDIAVSTMVAGSGTRGSYIMASYESPGTHLVHQRNT